MSQGTMNFKLGTEAKEYDGKRFGGRTVALEVPADVEGIRDRTAPDADAEQVIAGFIFGTGVNLKIQKWFKDEIADAKYSTGDVDEAIAAAVAVVNAKRFENPGTRGKNGTSKKARTEKLEAENAELHASQEASRALLEKAYRAMPAGIRKSVRADMLAAFSEEELNAMDQK